MKRGMARRCNGGQAGLEPATAASAVAACLSESTHPPFPGQDES